MLTLFLLLQKIHTQKEIS